MLLPGSWQQTETQWSPVIAMVAVLVSLVPAPLSVPGAMAPPFWVTPNQGSPPIMKDALAGIATMVAVAPTATDASMDGPVDAAPPLIVTEHQLRKFMTVSVAIPAGDPPSAGVTAIEGDEVLHATAAATARMPMLAISARARRFIVSTEDLRDVLCRQKRQQVFHAAFSSAVCVPHEVFRPRAGKSGQARAARSFRRPFNTIAERGTVSLRRFGRFVRVRRRVPGASGCDLATRRS